MSLFSEKQIKEFNSGCLTMAIFMFFGVACAVILAVWAIAYLAQHLRVVWA